MAFARSKKAGIQRRTTGRTKKRVRMRIIDENRSIRLRTSPENINIPLRRRRAMQKSMNERKGVRLKINIKNAIAEIRSIAPRTFNTTLIEKIENRD